MGKNILVSSWTLFEEIPRKLIWRSVYKTYLSIYQKSSDTKVFPEVLLLKFKFLVKSYTEILREHVIRISKIQSCKKPKFTKNGKSRERYFCGFVVGDHECVASSIVLARELVSSLWLGHVWQPCHGPTWTKCVANSLNFVTLLV